MRMDMRGFMRMDMGYAYEVCETGEHQSSIVRGKRARSKRGIGERRVYKENEVEREHRS